MSIDFNKLNSISGVESRLRNERELSSGQAGTSPASSHPDSSAEEVQLSREAQMLATGHTAQSEPVDAAKVERIRAEIAEGRYHVDPVRLAENFLNLEDQLAE